MNQRFGIGLIGTIAVILIVGYLAQFTVPQTQNALVLQFGEPKRVVTEPGLYFRWPIIEKVKYIDKRVLKLETPAKERLTLDQKRVMISAFVRYQIIDALKFYQVGQSIENANGQIESVLDSTLRSKIGNTMMTNILTPQRAELMAEITKDLTRQAAAPYGIRIVDVRFKRVDLPPQNSEAVFTQMRSQRAQEAAGNRADGARRALEIRAEADKKRVVTIAEAQKQSSILRGEGDAEATRVYNEAYSKDPAFFDFYRSMQAMREGLKSENTTFVGAPTGDFFRYFDHNGDNQAKPAGQ
jgi:membrane protease subunit HflC